VLAIRYPRMDLNAFRQPGKPVYDALPSALYQWTLDLADGSVGETMVCPIAGGTRARYTPC
jgi:hypothetical protein